MAGSPRPEASRRKNGFRLRRRGLFATLTSSGEHRQDVIKIEMLYGRILGMLHVRGDMVHCVVTSGTHRGDFDDLRSPLAHATAPAVEIIGEHRQRIPSRSNACNGDSI